MRFLNVWYHGVNTTVVYHGHGAAIAVTVYQKKQPATAVPANLAANGWYSQEYTQEYLQGYLWVSVGYNVFQGSFCGTVYSCLVALK